MTIETNERITALQDWLERGRGMYKEGLRNLSDPLAVRGLLKAILAKTGGALRFDPYRHPPEAAVAELTAIKERLGGVFSDIEFLEEYEEKQEEYKREIAALTGKAPEKASQPDGEPFDLEQP